MNKTLIFLSTLGFILFNVGLIAQQKLKVQVEGNSLEHLNITIDSNEVLINGQHPADLNMQVSMVREDQGMSEASYFGAKMENSKNGVFIKNISPGPAFGAGLRRNDVIISIDGDNVAVLDDMEHIINSKTPGDLIELVILRRNKAYVTRFYLSSKEDRVNILAPLNERVPLVKKETGKEKIGITLVEMIETQGMKVTAIEPNLPADLAGLKPGDIIKKINGKKINHLIDVTSLPFSKFKPLDIEFLRKGTQYLTKIKTIE
ncbi:MAG TPA: PDZ domain-containing protein [Saprospiraceae bacterium]|nr:PDZ domain-containing protein [Saprospiraceae bacterium]